MKRLLLLSYLVVGFAATIGLNANNAVAQECRSFHTGFTLWPAELTTEGVAAAVDFAHCNGDIVSVMLIGGIPWQESLDDKRVGCVKARSIKRSSQRQRDASVDTPESAIVTVPGDSH